ncbi:MULTISPECIES: citrate/2-methylcitrate synthase [Metabacillus]|jgi:citrate synthase|uniref:Citrate synthase n=1 Tax=Metabacillus rhizolycopersici TaxID=2875709 RepID=A0ABS7UVU9_9BACI|nr:MULTISPECIES: citrate/2-methylcitrate synthase [Metabacillus]MBZ5752132.1 citrate synthase [Metabacillus rhizolycopersici]MCM3654425.1 citrate synthase [Metabacillus litoralis]
MTTAGLEGVVATQSGISSIIDGVLTYRGINIDELARHARFEEVLYLLWHDELPTFEQLTQLKKELASQGILPDEIISLLKTFPKHTHPMAILRTVVSALEMYDPDAHDMSESANFRKALNIQAKISSVVAAIQRVREDKEILSPKREFTFAQNFLYMLNGENPEAIAIKSLDTALILHADHELNASTFAARVTVGTLANIYTGVVSAIGTLSGPLHGGANESVMEMLEEIGDIEHVEFYIRQAIAEKKKIMGFGHRVYKTGDPRAKFLKSMSKELTALKGQDKLYEISVKIDEILTKEKGLLPNVDFYSASTYHSLGIARDLFTPIFAVSRTSGWTAHILEQYANNRLIRPRAEYVGSQSRSYVPLEER